MSVHWNKKRNRFPLCGANPFVHEKIFVPVSIGQKLPHAPHNVVHVQSHKVRPGEDAAEVWIQKIRSPRLLAIGSRRQTFAGPSGEIYRTMYKQKKNIYICI